MTVVHMGLTPRILLGLANGHQYSSLHLHCRSRKTKWSKVSCLRKYHDACRDQGSNHRPSDLRIESLKRQIHSYLSITDQKQIIFGGEVVWWLDALNFWSVGASSLVFDVVLFP